MLDKVFAYGSLRSNMYNYEKYINNKVKSVKTGYAKGDLYQIKDKEYPALINGEDMIYGEVFEFYDFEETLKLLDELEEYEEDDVINSMYIREVMTISLEDGEHELAYVYKYNQGSVKNKGNELIKIECNDWVEYISK